MIKQHYSYIPISQVSPPKNEPLMTKISDEKGDRNEQILILKDNLWWTKDLKVYVYYAPTHWAKLKS